jgi:hypothetical protein
MLDGSFPIARASSAFDIPARSRSSSSWRTTESICAISRRCRSNSARNSESSLSRCPPRTVQWPLGGLNSKVRLISHRSFGFHSAAPLIALVYLCCGGVEIDLPFS